MGNRAVIQFGEDKDAVGIYLHWHGGQESVKAFLDAAKKFEAKTDEYGPARLCQIIGNFIGGTLSMGIGLARKLDRDNGDNGTYVVEGWEIKKRMFRHRGDEFSENEYRGTLEEVLRINSVYFEW